MASLLAASGIAIVNALAFTGTSAAFHALSSSDGERKRHNLATEKFQKDHNDWLEQRQTSINNEVKRTRAAQTSETHMQELDRSMHDYAMAYPEPQFHQYYHPSPNQKNQDFMLAAVSIVGLGAFTWYVTK